MKASVDQDVCIGCGMCVGTCDAVFDFNESGLAEVAGEITSDNEEDVKEAADNCPVGAITVE